MKKVLSMILSLAVFIPLSISCSAAGTYDGVQVYAMPAAQPVWNGIENVSLTFSITNAGNASVVYTVSGIPDSSNFLIKTYIEKRTMSLFWKRVNIGQPDDEWTDRTSKNYYINSHSVTVTEDGTYRATVKVITPRGDTIVKTAQFTFTKGVIRGDVNFDNKVTASDARLILRCAAGFEKFSSEQKTRGDLNSDGKITAADARLALRIAAGLI